MRGLLITVAPLGVERRLSSCGPWPELLRGVRNLPGSGTEFVCLLPWQVDSLPLSRQGSLSPCSPGPLRPVLAHTLLSFSGTVPSSQLPGLLVFLLAHHNLFFSRCQSDTTNLSCSKALRGSLVFLGKTKSDSSSWLSRPLMDGPDILSSLIPMWSCHAVPCLVARTCPLPPTSGLSICSLSSLPFSMCLNHYGPSRIGWSTVSPWSHLSLLGPALSLHPLRS